jgi:undecaprenyl-phosphate 4-deoxy-4-formamido-L-arabinose transferase
MNAVDLSVVVPVYNNATTLDELLDRLVHVLTPLVRTFEIIPVDDGSRDDSFAILTRRAAADPRIRPLALRRNFGGQAALCAGFDQVCGARVVCMDADLDNLPEDLPALLAALDRGYDLACGVRAQRRDALFARRLPSTVFNLYVRRRLGTTVHDIGCGMRAMDARLIHRLASEGEGRRLITPLLLRRATSVAEVHIGSQRAARRGGGHSFLSLLGIAADFYLYSARRPFLVGGLIAAATVAVGLLLLTACVLGAGATSGVLAVLLIGVGTVGGLTSLLGEYVQRLYQLAQGLPFYEIREDPPVRADEAGHESLRA